MCLPPSGTLKSVSLDFLRWVRCWPRVGNLQDFSVMVGTEEWLVCWSSLFYLE